MIMKLIEWIKNHKPMAVLLVIVVIFVGNIFLKNATYRVMNSRISNDSSYLSGQDYDVGYSKSADFEPSSEQVLPSVESKPINTTSVGIQKRMSSKNYSMSLVGKNLRDTSEKISLQVEVLGGFIISSSTKEFQDTESAYITARIPAGKAQEFVNMLKSVSQKIVTQDETASDITDQYTDVTENLRLLEETKVRFEEIWKASTKTQDMLQTLREIQNLQMDIDRLKGQQKYYEELAKYSYFNITLSKDEFDLPYLPSEGWSAEYVFRSAVRDLVRTTRGLAESVIWLVVYAIIWVPIGAVALFVVKKYWKQVVG